jgi:lipopolysaccharide biosynthesis protein
VNAPVARLLPRWGRRPLAACLDTATAVKDEAVYRSWGPRLQAAGRDPARSTAVVVHLFYPVCWARIEARLRVMRPWSFDLFVTVPASEPGAHHLVKRSFPGATVLTAPNRGRDALAFLHLAAILDRLGYTSVLKLHSKRSPHYEQGGSWFEELLDGVLPGPSVVDLIGSVMADPATGIVGPAGHYLSLTVKYQANRRHLGRIVTATAGPAAATAVDHWPGSYGFFAGTMFWARLDALRPLLAPGWGARHFQGERGQTDGTFAHAVERALTVVPELDGRIIWQAGPIGLARTPYGSGSVPDWATMGQTTGAPPLTRLPGLVRGGGRAG